VGGRPSRLRTLPEFLTVMLQRMHTFNPEDAGVDLRLTRNCAWAGKTGRAIAEYTSYLHAAPQDQQATIELIRLRSYCRDYSQAEDSVIGCCPPIPMTPRS